MRIPVMLDGYSNLTPVANKSFGVRLGHAPPHPFLECFLSKISISLIAPNFASQQC
ncbi:hypothetical protein MPLA_670158 [Mesorhizobium sp. ORS 3359]|nr:hypothetical protein MPLA_670158 [Mesorhizobium sp. ORS 3359]